MVLLFLADGFEEIEALTQVDYLRRAGIEIVTVGITGEYVSGTRGIVVKADTTIEKVKYNSDVQMVVLPGGLGGTNAMKADKRVTDIVRLTCDNGGFVAAICAAPTILAEMGLLKGRNCTCYPDMQNILAEHGAKVVDTALVSDGKLITARAAGASEQFALELIRMLKGQAASEKVRVSICARQV